MSFNEKVFILVVGLELMVLPVVGTWSRFQVLTVLECLFSMNILASPEVLQNDSRPVKETEVWQLIKVGF